MISISNTSLVRLRWVDITHHGFWLRIEDAMTAPIIENYTVGFLVTRPRRNDPNWRIASTFSMTGAQVGSVTVIPAKCALTWEELGTFEPKLASDTANSTDNLRKKRKQRGKKA